MRRWLAAIVAIAALLPATALARQLATRSQHAAMVAAGVAAHDINKQQGPCMQGWVSTVNRSYGMLIFTPPWTAYCRKWAADGYALFHRVRGHWRFVTAGSDLRCPIRGIPTRVARDLKVC